MKPPPRGWPFAIQVAVATITTICLSIWQVSRGFEKLNLLDTYKSQLAAPPLTNPRLISEKYSYRRVELVGTFDANRSFLIENRQHLGRPGYWVFGVFDTDYGSFLLNRGWVSMGSNRRSNPEFEAPTSQIKVVGVVWPTSTNTMQLYERNDNWPIRMRSLNISRMAQLGTARAQEIRLSANSPGVLIAAPLIVEFGTAKHWGYAFQWLLIGCVIVAGYWYFAIRRALESA